MRTLSGDLSADDEVRADGVKALSQLVVLPSPKTRSGWPDEKAAANPRCGRIHLMFADLKPRLVKYRRVEPCNDTNLPRAQNEHREGTKFCVSGGLQGFRRRLRPCFELHSQKLADSHGGSRRFESCIAHHRTGIFKSGLSPPSPLKIQKSWQQG
jgi:hypothetical protein